MSQSGTGGRVWKPVALGLALLATLAASTPDSKQLSLAASQYHARDFASAAATYALAFADQPEPGVDGGGQVLRTDVDHIVLRARSLQKLGRYAEALTEIDHATAAAAVVIQDGQVGERHSVDAALSFDRGRILVCDGRIEEAITAQIASFDALSQLFAVSPTVEVEAQLESRMLELVKLYRWSGYDEDADGMLLAAVPTHPQQWPAKYNPSLASTAQPWHSLTTPPGGPQVAQELEALVRWLQENERELQDEYHRLKAAGMVTRQPECLFDLDAVGEWRQFGLWYNKEDSECSMAAPVACKLAHPAESWAAAVAPADEGCTDSRLTTRLPEPLKLQFLRIGYSVVDGRARIRPHTGPTNEQLKLHYGLIIPPPGPSNCTWVLRVAGQTRPWIQGTALLFDDSWEHEVLSVCAAPAESAGERVVLQITMRHPELL